MSGEYVRVSEGPYRHLWGERNAVGLLDDYQYMISKYDVPGRRILIYPYQPAGYLFSKMRPAAPSVIGMIGESVPLFLERLESDLPNTELVVRIKKQGAPRIAKFDQFIREKFKEDSVSSQMVIYTRKTPLFSN